MQQDTNHGFGRTEFHTTIVDDYGQKHRYEIVQFTGGEGFFLLPKISRVFLNPLARAFKAMDWQALMKAMQAGAQEAAQDALLSAKGTSSAERAQSALKVSGAALGGKSGAASLEKLLDMEVDLDVPEISEALGELFTRFEDEGGVDLLKGLFKHCVRSDGEDASGPKRRVADDFDAIFQGNYGEAVRAAWWSIKVNFGPALKNLPFGKGGRTR